VAAVSEEKIADRARDILEAHHITPIEGATPTQLIAQVVQHRLPIDATPAALQAEMRQRALYVTARDGPVSIVAPLYRTGPGQARPTRLENVLQTSDSATVRLLTGPGAGPASQLGLLRQLPLSQRPETAPDAHRTVQAMVDSWYAQYTAG
jgi:hypothetical protein